MKDLEVDASSTRISFINGDSNSAATSNVDDVYDFSDDQKKAAQELQMLYRKLGLEELDDGYEEGFSAYDDPQYDIVGKLKDVNNRFNEDSTPLESNRLRKVHFKESVVDLVVPISPIRSTFDKYDYLEQDDDYYDDFGMPVYVDENQNEIDKVKGEEPGVDYIEGETYRRSFDNDVDESFENTMGEKRDLTEETEKMTENEDDNELGKSEAESESEEEKQDSYKGDEDENNDSAAEITPERDSNETAEQKETSNLTEGTIVTKKEAYEIDSEINNQTDLKVKFTSEFKDSKPRIQSVKAKISENRPSTSTKHQDTSLATRVRPQSATQSFSRPLIKKNVQRPSSSKTFVATSKNIANSNCRPVKPDKDLPIYEGNSRSKYGVSEELKRELRKLRQLEAIQKKLKEQELSESRRRKREEAELAFRAWLESKNADKTKADVKNVYRDSTKAVNCSNSESEQAFQAWLEQKENQQKKENFLQQLKELEESDLGLTSRMRREQSKRAYRKWLKKKNNQRRQQMSLDSPMGFHFSNFTYSLPQMIHQADMLKQTFQAYFGKMTW